MLTCSPGDVYKMSCKTRNCLKLFITRGCKLEVFVRASLYCKSCSFGLFNHWVQFLKHCKVRFLWRVGKNKDFFFLIYRELWSFFHLKWIKIIFGPWCKAGGFKLGNLLTWYELNVYWELYDNHILPLNNIRKSVRQQSMSEWYLRNSRRKVPGWPT